LEIPLKGLFKRLTGRREIDFVFYFERAPAHYYEVKTEKDGERGFKEAVRSLFDLYGQDSGGAFHIILSAGMSPKVQQMTGIINHIKGKSKIENASKKSIINFFGLKEREFKSYRPFFDRLKFVHEGLFDVDSQELVRDGPSLDAIIKSMLDNIPYDRRKFGDWPPNGLTKDDIISSLLIEIARICSEKLSSKRKIERRAFLEKLTELLARNKAFAKNPGPYISQDDISSAQKELLRTFYPAQRILAEKVDSMKEPSKT
jgi:hypothetical protein